LPQLLLQNHNHIACPVKVHVQDMLENKDTEGWAASKKISCGKCSQWLLFCI